MVQSSTQCTCVPWQGLSAITHTRYFRHNYPFVSEKWNYINYCRNLVIINDPGLLWYKQSGPGRHSRPKHGVTAHAFSVGIGRWWHSLREKRLEWQGGPVDNSNIGEESCDESSTCCQLLVNCHWYHYYRMRNQPRSGGWEICGHFYTRYTNVEKQEEYTSEGGGSWMVWPAV